MYTIFYLKNASVFWIFRILDFIWIEILTAKCPFTFIRSHKILADVHLNQYQGSYCVFFKKINIEFKKYR